MRCPPDLLQSRLVQALPDTQAALTVVAVAPSRCHATIPISNRTRICLALQSQLEGTDNRIRHRRVSTSGGADYNTGAATIPGSRGSPLFFFSSSRPSPRRPSTISEGAQEAPKVKSDGRAGAGSRSARGLAIVATLAAARLPWRRRRGAGLPAAHRPVVDEAGLSRLPSAIGLTAQLRRP